MKRGILQPWAQVEDEDDITAADIAQDMAQDRTRSKKGQRLGLNSPHVSADSALNSEDGPYITRGSLLIPEDLSESD